MSPYLQATLASEKDQKSSQIVPHVPLYMTSTRPMCSPYVPLTNRIPSISVPFLNRLGNWPAEEGKLIQVIHDIKQHVCPNALKNFELHLRVNVMCLAEYSGAPLQLTLSHTVPSSEVSLTQELVSCLYARDYSGASGTFSVGVVCQTGATQGAKATLRFSGLC